MIDNRLVFSPPQCFDDGCSIPMPDCPRPSRRIRAISMDKLLSVIRAPPVPISVGDTKHLDLISKVKLPTLTSEVKEKSHPSTTTSSDKGEEKTTDSQVKTEDITTLKATNSSTDGGVKPTEQLISAFADQANISTPDPPHQRQVRRCSNAAA